MSILDALRVQKANQASISEIARLPQNVIVSMAQTGDLPAHVVPIVLNEKARIAEQMANLQAAAQMQQQPPQTVIEKAMQTNARAEMPQGIATPQLQPNVAAPQMPPNMGAPQMPPSMGAPQMQQKITPQQMQQGEPKPQMPPAQGVTALPTSQMFQQQNYRSGGIVAFNGEDGSYVDGEDQFVPDSTGLLTLPEEAPVMPAEKARSLADIIAETQRAMAPYQQPTPERAALLQAMQKPGRDLEQDKWMRLIEAGLAMAGGQSPYAFANIGRASEALRGYGQDVQAARQEQMNRMKMAADIAEQQRGEQRGVAQTGIQRYDTELNRQRMLEAERRKLLAEQIKARTAAEREATRERIAEADRKARLEAERIRAEKDRETDMKRFGNAYLEAKVAEGDKREKSAILQEGYEKYLQARPQVTAGAQTAIAGGAQEVSKDRQFIDLVNEISDKVDKSLKLGAGTGSLRDTFKKTNEERKQAGKEPISMEDFRNQQIQKRIEDFYFFSQSRPAPAAGQRRPPPDIDALLEKYK